MNRKMYQPTANQEKRWARFEEQAAIMPTDEAFKAMWKKAHHGKEVGWGIGKRNWIISNMAKSREYQMGIWQGRVDKARGLEYAEERNENTYNLGYYRGYNDYESDRRGWDAETRARFDEQYTNSEAEFGESGLGIGRIADANQDDEQIAEFEAAKIVAGQLRNNPHSYTPNHACMVCGAPADMMASMGPACQDHYDELS